MTPKQNFSENNRLNRLNTSRLKKLAAKRLQIPLEMQGELFTLLGSEKMIKLSGFVILTLLPFYLAGQESSIPKESHELIKKLEKWEAMQYENVATAVVTKRNEVAKILSQQLEQARNRGDTKAVELLEAEIKQLKIEHENLLTENQKLKKERLEMLDYIAKLKKIVSQQK